MTVFDRRPRLRWIAPIAAGAVVAAAVVGASAATADSGLPERTPAELLVALQQATSPALSGTVSVSADLGLPDLSMVAGAGAGASGPGTLLAGTHTLRVWTDGQTRSRVDLLGSSDEFDVVRDGPDVWTWSSAQAQATHASVPDRAAGGLASRHGGDAMAMPSTPQEAADLVLSTLDPTTLVTTTGTGSVAGRPAYDLVLSPKQDGTRVSSVVISLDAATSVPLRVRIYSTAGGDPAVDVGFTSVDFAAPKASVFAFTPPPGATVTERGSSPIRSGADAKHLGGAQAPIVVGEGWTSVLVLPSAAEMHAGSPSGEGSDQWAAMLQVLPRIEGSWGTGRVLDGTLFSAILADDGRVAVGAVTPELLEAALAAQ